MIDNNLIGDDDYREAEAVYNEIAQELKDQLDLDKLVYFGDLVFDYFDSRGFMSDEDDEEEVEFNYDELLSYLCKELKRDGIINLPQDDIALLLDAQLNYYDRLSEDED